MTAPIECTYCKTGLSGGLDTFGHARYPYCASCWLNPTVYKIHNINEEAIEDCFGVNPERIIKCDFCYGTGSFAHDCDCDHCDIHSEMCDECNGDGYITVTRSNPMVAV